MTHYRFSIVSSLEKVFPTIQPKPLLKGAKMSGFYGETISFQLAYYMEYSGIDLSSQKAKINLISELKEQICIRSVELVPSMLPAYGLYDDNYITTSPGLFPDLLKNMEDNSLPAYPNQWRAVWFDLLITPNIEAKEYPVVLRAKFEDNVIWEDTIKLQIINAALPLQQLIHTEWLHADCLAQYYKVPVFSNAHWTILENYIATAVKRGVNMLLTPIFTPPLDTSIGGERTTVQLVYVKKSGNRFFFDFKLLLKWINIAKSYGIQYFEISHLFTQWGAKYAPKILAEENGMLIKLFGWEIESTDIEYTNFLHQFLPKLIIVLKQEGVFSNTYFHISDEPHEDQKQSYAAAKETVKELLKDCKIIDALSSLSLYQEGIVEHPVVCNNHIQAFLDAGVDGLWTYYCCAQMLDVSNRFMAMPSARNRILGIQLYLYQIQGFLHWGYNFYNSQYSLTEINPYQVTDANGAFPSGDPFLVYPGEDGTALESIRIMVLSEALYDMRALALLESMTDRSFVKSLIYENHNEKITFCDYPKSDEYILQLRERVNQEIAKLLTQSMHADEDISNKQYDVCAKRGGMKECLKN